MAATCNIDEVVDEYNPDNFKNTNILKFIHDRVPRFGSTNDIMVLVNGTDEEKKDYLKGLVASSVAMFIFFLLWTMVLTYFKCRGPKNYGWLSGRFDKIPPRPNANSSASQGIEVALTKDETQDEGGDVPQQEQPLADKREGGGDVEKVIVTHEEEMITWEQNYERTKRRHFMLKCFVFLGGVFVILSSVLLVAKGVDSLRGTIDASTETIILIQGLLRDGIDLLQTIINSFRNVKEDIIGLIVAVNGICPKVREKICSNITDSSTCVTEGIFERVDLYPNLIRQFQEFDGRSPTLVDRLTIASEDLDAMIAAGDNMNENTQSFDGVLKASMAFAIFTSTLVLCFMIGMFIQKKNRLVRCIQHGFIMPLFIVLVVLSFILAIVFIIASLGLSDTCVDNPDERILSIVEQNLEPDDSVSPIVYEFIKNYLSGCQAPPAEIQMNFEFLQRGKELMESFSGELAQFMETKQDFCGITEAADGSGTLLTKIAERSEEYMCTTTTIVRDFMAFFKCETWHPFYEVTVHDAMCHGATDGFGWIASSQFVAVFGAVILLTCRAALFDLEFEEESDEEDAEEEDANKVQEDANSQEEIEAAAEEVPAEQTQPQY